MSELCPGCGAEGSPTKSNPVASFYFDCGSAIATDGEFYPSKACNQLAAALEREAIKQKRIDELMEVWFVADQTIGCHFCGWIDWNGKEHSKDCPIGYMTRNSGEREAKLREERDRWKGLAESNMAKFASNIVEVAQEATIHCFTHPEEYPSLMGLRGCLKPPHPNPETSDE